MTSLMRWAMVAAVGLDAGGSGWAVAADPAPTTIALPDMDCAACAKKVGGKVAAVRGVGKIECNVQARTLTVTPKAGESLSPRALWEACVATKQEPSKLEGPGGVFTAKPEE